VSPGIKYTLARVGLFVVATLLLLPLHLNFLLTLMIAVVISAVASLVLLRRWRNELAESLVEVNSRRRAEKEQLRAALAGDDAVAATDRPGSSEGPGSPDGPDHAADVLDTTERR